MSYQRLPLSVISSFYSESLRLTATSPSIKFLPSFQCDATNANSFIFNSEKSIAATRTNDPSCIRLCFHSLKAIAVMVVSGSGNILRICQFVLRQFRKMIRFIFCSLSFRQENYRFPDEIEVFFAL